ncbi:extracellular solute-binding protein [Cohnella lubricantis]|uniref:Extracellular solute-binding protein n=1 Tax=Cohnella lubricantis TaxID=2163172 RepID=A0A841TFN3_9BACL|nr:extracellular solute-binding protein [Cohnella lubricantis]MBB6677281.1 extracellular solute-binding protein [Cohnella lubricantis]MBP2116907.1 multiple sugar transport system substrate-binding protein [Cohnella lubricantis]
MNNRKASFRKWTLAAMSAAILIPSLAACTSKSEDDPNNRRTLRIGTMYGSQQDESYFRQQFTDMFELTHDGIDLEIVPAIDYTEQQFEQPNPDQPQPDPVEKVKEIMNGDNPVDVMIIQDPSLLESLIQENLVKQLDTLLKEDKIDTSTFVPAVIDGIKDAGDGSLYALAPTYTPSALFYNKKAFSDAGVEVPTGSLTWDDVFNLARRLKTGTGKDTKFGFALNSWGYSNGYYDLQTYAAPLQLKLFDDNAEQMTVNTPQWEKVWTTITDLYKDHILPSNEDLQVDQPQPTDTTIYNPYQGQPFFNGKVAMVIGSYSMINDLEVYNKNYQKFEGAEALDWDVLPVPTFAENPGVSSYVNLSTLAAINAKAANPDDAWEFVKFMNGEEWGKLRSRSSYEMPTLKEFVKPKEGMSYNIDAFTSVKPFLSQNNFKENLMYQERPNLYLIQQLAQIEYDKVMQGQLTVKEALAEMETKGNDLLQKIKLSPKGEIDTSGIFDDVYGGGGPIKY